MAGKCQIVHTVKKDKMGSPGELQTGLPNQNLRKTIKKIFLETISKQIKDNNEVRNR